MKLRQTGLLFLVAVTNFPSLPAYAQSNVTLYGVLDEGLMYLSNIGGTTSGKKFYLDSVSGISGSRWGLQGSEDLGGGLNAIFTLESGLNINSGTFGQGGTPFGRQVFVGLRSDRYGSLTFGRQYDMVVYFSQPVTTIGTFGSVIFGHPGDLDNTANTVRTNNEIRYTSPNYSGLKFGAAYSVGGVPGNTTANNGYSLGASYATGPLTLSTAYLYFKDPTSATAGSGYFTDNTSGASVLSGSLNKGYASAKAYQVAVAGASYTIGSLAFVSSYSNIQYANLGAPLLNGTARFNNVDFGVRYYISPLLVFETGYDYLSGKGIRTADGRTIGNQHYHQVGLMADYLLSKRTDIYLTGAWQRASGVSSTGGAAVADITLQGDSSSNHQLLIRAALRHKF